MISLVQPVDWVAIGPTLAVAVGSLVVLLADLWLPAARRAALRWSTLAVIAVAGGLLVAQTGRERGTFCVDAGGGLLACSFVVEPITWALQGISLAGAAVVTMLPTRDAGRTSGSAAATAGRFAGEYHFLLLASLAGAMSIAAARDVLTLVVALEVLSLPAFAIIALPTGQTADRPAAAEAAVKAFLVSVVSLAVMLLGAALLYGVTGTLHLEPLAAALVEGPTSTAVAAVGATLLLAGLLFKVAAVPFHGWVPDAYVGAPIRVAAFLSVVSKSGGFAGLLVVLWFGLRPYGEAWGTVLAVIAALTMTIGNLGALRQTQVVRLLAWSSIAQSGFMLVPLAAAGLATRSRGVGLDGAAASIAYLAVYAVVNLGAFAVVAAVDHRRPGGAAGMSDYTGLVRTSALAGIGLAFFLVSLAGLPPGVAGLVTKVVVIRSAVDAGLGWLAVVMAVNVVLGLAYYLRWTAMIFTRPDDRRYASGPEPRMTGTGATTAAVALALVAAVALSVWPQAVLAVL